MKTVKCPECKSTEVTVLQGYALAIACKCLRCRKLFVKEVKK